MEHKEDHDKEHHHIKHKRSDRYMIKKSDLWKYTTVLAVLLLVILLVKGSLIGDKACVSEMVSSEEAAQNAIDYINTNLVQPGTSASLKNIGEPNSGVYSIDISVQGQEYKSYVTQDGKLLFINGIDMIEKAEDLEQPTAEPEPQINQKSDKPEVELFVMSHCPYGTQSEKGIIPAVKALGNSIDFKLRFVSYAMHGEVEVTEQARQYCIQKEQTNKFLNYLECFLKEGNSEACLTEAKIDLDKLNACVAKADKEFNINANLNDKSQWLNGRFPQFKTDLELNSKYGVRGSPTLIINGAQAQSSRDSASYLRTICAAFNDAPEACNTELSSTPSSPGFGYSESSPTTANAAGCGA